MTTILTLGVGFACGVFATIIAMVLIADNEEHKDEH